MIWKWRHMDEFTKLVERCAKNLENHTIFNASTDHAIVLFKNLIEVAERWDEEVKIFSGSFSCTVYDSLIEPLKKALAKNIKFTLIAECAAAHLETNAFVNAVKNHPKGKVIALNDKVNFPHFILVGTSRYRVELDDALRTARANFNDAATGATLLSIYNQLIALSSVPA